MRKKQQTRRAGEFSRREREIMDIVYRRGEATAAEVLAELADPPSYSAVRSTLSILEEKGHLAHRHDGNRYVYVPTVDLARARSSALEHLLTTFFDGSAAEAVTALIAERGDELPQADLDRLEALIRQARREGR
jgi:predicted transcriptional regulator